MTDLLGKTDADKEFAKVDNRVQAVGPLACAACLFPQKVYTKTCGKSDPTQSVRDRPHTLSLFLARALSLYRVHLQVERKSVKSVSDLLTELVTSNAKMVTSNTKIAENLGNIENALQKSNVTDIKPGAPLFFPLHALLDPCHTLLHV